MNEPFNFSEALILLKRGKQVQRIGWNGKGMFLTLVSSNQYSVSNSVWEGDTLPFIAMKTADVKLVPWLASQTDILADDWQTYSPFR